MQAVFEKKIRSPPLCLCADHGLLCVCHTLVLRVFHVLTFSTVTEARSTFSTEAGGHGISLGLCPTKLPVKWDIQLGQLDVPARSFTSCYPTFPRFDSWSFMILPTNHFPSALQLLTVTCRLSAFGNIFQQYCCTD